MAQLSNHPHYCTSISLACRRGGEQQYTFVPFDVIAPNTGKRLKGSVVTGIIFTSMFRGMEGGQ